jgi:hypothetical protein
MNPRNGMGIALFESLCKLCKHRRGLGCVAFPRGIPLEIREMHVDHRLPYPGDNGITFEPKDQSEQTLRRLEQVEIRKGRVPAGPNHLDRRISRVWKVLQFEDVRQERLFHREVRVANTFEELPLWCRQAIEEAEARQQPGRLDTERRGGDLEQEAGSHPRSAGLVRSCHPEETPVPESPPSP